MNSNSVTLSKAEYRNDLFTEFQWDQKTKYSENFEINGKKVTKINSDRDWYQITNIKSLPKEKTSCLTFKIQNYGLKGSYMTMGIITEKKKQNKDSDLDETAFYVTSKKFKQGHMHVDENEVEEKKQDLFLDVGDELLMEVDLQRYSISFSNKNRKISHELKKDHWKEQEIYIFIQIFEKDGSIEVIN